jgi:hypothetical protein
MEAICSSETSVETQRTTRRHIPEDDTLLRCFLFSPNDENTFRFQDVFRTIAGEWPPSGQVAARCDTFHGFQRWYGTHLGTHGRYHISQLSGLKVAILPQLMQRLPPCDVAQTRDNVYFYSAEIDISVITFRQVMCAVSPNAQCYYWVENATLYLCDVFSLFDVQLKSTTVNSAPTSLQMLHTTVFIGTMLSEIFTIDLETFEVKLHVTCHRHAINDIAFPQ